MATLKRYTTFEELKSANKSNAIAINDYNANLHLFEYQDFLNLLTSEFTNKKKITKDKVVDGKKVN